MENLPAPSQPSAHAAPPQRHVRLRRAVIHTDGARLHRTAEFTDGSTRIVEMRWPDVRRVAAFRRDVLTDPVLCVAISDPANIVVLDESMEGWQSLTEALSNQLAAGQDYFEWRRCIGEDTSESQWTVLFRADA